MILINSKYPIGLIRACMASGVVFSSNFLRTSNGLYRVSSNTSVPFQDCEKPFLIILSSKHLVEWEN